MCDEICARSPILENKVSFNQILIHKNAVYYTLVTLQLALVWQILPKIALTLGIAKNSNLY